MDTHPGISGQNRRWHGIGKNCLVVRLSDFSGPEEMLQEISHTATRDSFDFVYLHAENLQLSDDLYIQSIEASLRAVKEHFDVFTTVEIQPPNDLALVDALYALPADGVNFPLGVFHPDRFDGVYPAKSRSRILAALERAVINWPSGTVLSTLFLGRESIESLLDGIESLAGMGVIPHLVPESGIGAVAFTQTQLEKVYIHLFDAIQKARISQRWLNHFEVTSGPFEGREVRNGKQQRRRSWLVRRIALEMLQLRRRLRVKEVGESLDSSGL